MNILLVWPDAWSIFQKTDQGGGTQAEASGLIECRYKGLKLQNLLETKGQTTEEEGSMWKWCPMKPQLLG